MFHTSRQLLAWILMEPVQSAQSDVAELVLLNSPGLCLCLGASTQRSRGPEALQG